MGRFALENFKSLGLSRNPTKEKIKKAFRRFAMEFHLDRHSHSPKSVRDGTTLRFKQASEAYEVLMDDRKRADYNLRCNAGRASGYNSRTGFNSSGYGYGYYGHPHTGPNYSYTYYSRGSNGYGFVSKFEIALRFLTTRSFLLNLAFAG